MDRAEMKRFLIKSKQEPVHCALGVGQDKSLALLLLSPHRSAKSLAGDLQKQFPSVFNARFGTAEVDPDDDPTLVKFRLNKPVTSMARRLVKTLKGSGFRKVQILLEDGSPVESADDEETASRPGDEETAPRPGDGSPQDAPQPDAKALAQALAELVRRIGEVTDPARKEALASRAREANANLRMSNLVYAAVGIESLRRALGTGPASSNSAETVNQPPGHTLQQTEPPPPSPPTGAAPSGNGETDAAAVLARLRALVPAILQAGATPSAAEAKARVGEAGALLRTGDLTGATVAIDAAEAALRKAQDATTQREAWESRLRTVEPRYLQAVTTPSPVTETMRVIMNFATGKAEAGDYAAAMAALGRLEPLLAAAPAAADIGLDGNPAAAAFLAAWTDAARQLRTATETARVQLGRLGQALMASNDPGMIWIAEQGLSDVLAGLLDGAGRIERAASKLPAKTLSLARPVIAALRRQLADPRVKACDDNSYGVPVSVQATIRAPLDVLEQVLTTAPVH
jgi:hypothetical protein